MVCEKALVNLDRLLTNEDADSWKSERITKWLDEHTQDKDEISLPYFYMHNLDFSSVEKKTPLKSLQNDEFTSERIAEHSQRLVQHKMASVDSDVSDSVSSDSSFDDSADEDDIDSVFGSIIDDCQLGVPQNLVNNREKLNSDLVISKTIQGLEVLKVKWNTSNNDLLLKVENKLFPVHKSLLTSHSAYLNERLSKDSDELIVDVQGSIADVTVLLGIIYECGWSLNENNVDGVLKACKLLRMKGIVHDECEQYKKFLQRTSTSNLGTIGRWRRKKFLELFKL